MKKTMHKIFWTWEFEKEEKWLNEMSAKGLQLCDVGYCRYTFVEGTPGEYLYRLELLDYWPTNDKSREYIGFMEDTGAEYIGALFRWVYFRKKAEASGFDLFSDIDSRLKHLDRILLLAGILFGLMLFNAINSILNLCDAKNMFIGYICCAVALLIGYGFFRLLFKRRKLKKEKLLYE